MAENTVRPIGVVIRVDDVPYVVMFPQREDVVIANGQTLTLALDGVTTGPWAGPDNMAGMLPLRDLEAPRPPKFDTAEEAEAWLDQYPQHA